MIVSVNDVRAYLGEDVDSARAQLFCDLAEGVLAQAVGGTLPDPVPPVFRTVALAAITRVITNPRGVISETVGSYSYNLNRNDQSSGLALTADERRLLRRAVGATTVRSVPLQLPAQSRERAW